MPILPRIGITMGDPAGIGPEIIVKALSDSDLYRRVRPVIIGDLSAVAGALKHTSGMTLREVETVSEAGEQAFVLDVLPISRLAPGDLNPGVPTVEGGKAMVAAVTKAVDLALQGELEGVVTGPISKALMQRAGYAFEGHTQLLAHLTGARDVVMMLAGSRLRVVLVTIHRPLRDVAGLLTEEAVFRTTLITNQGLCSDFNMHSPRIAVAALNPHAGEQGLFGDEEERIISPAVQRARAEGVDAEGPLPADTVFYKAVSEEFDAVVCMYHDQGLIPLKLMHFADGVNITLGLPVIRTSVDHGTAYDIAGKGKADPSSLKAALRTAASMALNRRSAEQSQQL